jgi:hypothetical protein
MKLSICQQFTRHASLWLTVGLVTLYGLATGQRMSWNPIARNTWLACTAAVLLYFWFN